MTRPLMRIRNAEIAPGRFADLRIADGIVTELRQRPAPVLAAGDGRRDPAACAAAVGGTGAAGAEVVIDAAGCALLPGLHDHHIHLRALAAAQASVRCGPPQVSDAASLAAALTAADRALGPGQWLRGVGYHDSVAGAIDRSWLDAVLPGRPLRIQHRSGRLWLLNSAAIDALAPAADAPLERQAGRYTGRLFDADDWLRGRLPRQPLSLDATSRLLARYGITGVTDTTHHNDRAAVAWLQRSREAGALRQRLRVMGDASLDALANDAGFTPASGRAAGAAQGRGDAGIAVGEHKFHLHEHALPDFESLCAAVARSHEAGRGCAFHCVTRSELVFALAALRAAGGGCGDRIEHASVVPPELLPELVAAGVTVVTQPVLVHDRGDSYLREVAAVDRPWLYRLRGLVDAGVALALSSDAPFGSADPWLGMQAAVSRATCSGALLGAGEALSAEAAVAAYLAPLAQPDAAPRRLVSGVAADLCLLDRSWRAMLAAPGAVQVRATLIAGELVWSAADAGAAGQGAAGNAATGGPAASAVARAGAGAQDPGAQPPAIT